MSNGQGDRQGDKPNRQCCLYPSPRAFSPKWGLYKTPFPGGAIESPASEKAGVKLGSPILSPCAAVPCLAMMMRQESGGAKGHQVTDKHMCVTPWHEDGSAS